MATHEGWTAGPPLLGARVGGIGLSRDCGKALLFGAPFVVVVAMVVVEAAIRDRIQGVARIVGPAADITGAASLVALCVVVLLLGLVCITVAATTFRSFGRSLITRRIRR